MVFTSTSPRDSLRRAPHSSSVCRERNHMRLSLFLSFDNRSPPRRCCRWEFTRSEIKWFMMGTKWRLDCVYVTLRLCRRRTAGSRWQIPTGGRVARRAAPRTSVSRFSISWSLIRAFQSRCVFRCDPDWLWLAKNRAITDSRGELMDYSHPRERCFNSSTSSTSKQNANCCCCCCCSLLAVRFKVRFGASHERVALKSEYCGFNEQRSYVGVRPLSTQREKPPRTSFVCACVRMFLRFGFRLCPLWSRLTSEFTPVITDYLQKPLPADRQINERFPSFYSMILQYFALLNPTCTSSK